MKRSGRESLNEVAETMIRENLMQSKYIYNGHSFKNVASDPVYYLYAHKRDYCRRLKDTERENSDLPIGIRIVGTLLGAT